MRTLLLVCLLTVVSMTAPVAAQTVVMAEEGLRRVLERPEEATHLVRGGHGLFGVWHTDAWVHEAGGDGSGGDANEIGFQLQNGEALAVVLFDPTVVPLDSLRGMIVASAGEDDPDLRVVLEEPRTVNGVDVLYIEYRGGADRFSFQVTLHVDRRGTFHLMTVVPTSLLAQNRGDVERLHRGVVVFEPQD